MVDWGWGGCCDVYNVEIVEITILDGYNQTTKVPIWVRCDSLRPSSSSSDDTSCERAFRTRIAC